MSDAPSHFMPSQEDIDRAMDGWRRDPVAMRARLIAAGTTVIQKLTAMCMATQEEAAFGAFERGESSIYIGSEQPCPVCKIMYEALGMGGIPTLDGLLEVAPTTRSIWMGPERRWVCEMCMLPRPTVGPDPVFKDAKRSLN